MCVCVCLCVCVYVCVCVCVCVCKCKCMHDCFRVCVCQVLLLQTVVSNRSISGEIKANHGLLNHLSINTVDHCTRSNLQLLSSVCVYSVC